MRAFIVVEVPAGELFEDGNVNWAYCQRYAPFCHREACEFIIHVGPEGEADDYFKSRVAEMVEYGCTPDFITAYREAAALGAEKVLFYV